MSDSKCDKCHKILSGKQALKRHSDRKFPCKAVDVKINEENNRKTSKKQPTKNQPIYQPKTNQNQDFLKTTFSCKFCKQIFKHKNNLYTHQTHLRCSNMPNFEMKIRALKLKRRGVDKLYEVTKNKIKSLKI